MVKGGKRQGAGRKKSAPTKTKCFRISAELFEKLKQVESLNKLVTEFLESLVANSI